jgi:hypothetical protein
MGIRARLKTLASGSHGFVKMICERDDGIVFMKRFVPEIVVLCRTNK